MDPKKRVNANILRSKDIANPIENNPSTVLRKSAVPNEKPGRSKDSGVVAETPERSLNDLKTKS